MAKISNQQLKKHLYLSVLCGGGGKRLWPRSRKKSPKQFIDLFGEMTVFQQSMKRAKKVVTADKIYIITNCSYVGDVLTQDHDLILRNIIAEPQAKNTALAMGMAAISILKKGLFDIQKMCEITRSKFQSQMQDYENKLNKGNH